VAAEPEARARGIHHVTLISADVQANVDFYVGFLGLRLVKRTGGYEDPRQLHLFYGDVAATPGSLITFLMWQGGSSGRPGEGQIGEIALAIDPASIGFWLERALSHQVRIEGTAQIFGEPALRLRDPDGVFVTLVGAVLPALEMPPGDIPPQHAIRRIRGVTLLSGTPEESVGFLTQRFGWRETAREAGTVRLVSEIGDALDIRDASGFWPAAPGAGTVDHVALRAADADEVTAREAELRRLNSSLTTLHDRQYFTSLYVREPGGILIEMASDGPGFTLDEPLETLGTKLFMPPDAVSDAADIAVMLPQFGLPGAPRIVYRDLTHRHRIHVPDDPDGTTMLLLHGTGGDETDLMPLAHRAAPHATLLGLRGRSTEDGTQRWFRMPTADGFNQKDIIFEAGALDAFIAEAVPAYGIDPARLVALGYSNGANLLAATLAIHPGTIRRAVLLRPAQVLTSPPVADLSGTAVLIVLGADDPYRAEGLALTEDLRRMGAEVTLTEIDAGHALADADRAAISAWLAANL
jgi:phospholipase/carboxylesterase